ncbi:hypothetical protein H8K20_04095 [Neobittarella massiliensis]|uniref:ABC transporter permease n=1 Tax=Neobittarella massiliensis (ex Bilen et al. 2018) TaxID=2041842 RepID=A0A8J6M107_9FIRM|nr:putative ABC transporter permease [Neobittarella massiliensis]MBC3515581.1 hypothetical protein [Neobittarella massiliensis]
METVVLTFLYLAFYSFVGWMCETVYCSVIQRKLVNRGFLGGPVCPIYGFGALAVIFCLTPVRKSPWAVFLLGMLLTTCLEYFTSWAMEKLFHTRWWDYSQFKLQINGRVCLLNSLEFGALCLFVMYVLHPRVETMFGALPVWALWTLAAVLLALFIVDSAVTLRALLGLDRDTASFAQVAQELRLKLEESGVTAGAEEFIERVEGYFDGKKEQLAQLAAELEERRDDRRAQRGAGLQKLLARLQALSQEESFAKRRLRRAFPHMRSTRYSDQLAKLHQSLRQKLRQKEK